MSNSQTLTCGEPIPLRIFLEQLENVDTDLYLQTFIVRVRAHVKIQVGATFDVPETSRTITERRGIAEPVIAIPTLKGESAGAEDDGRSRRQSRVLELNTGSLSSHPIPRDFLPRFSACNIKRSYQLHVHIGVSSNKRASTSETAVVAFDVPVTINSGLRPYSSSKFDPKTKASNSATEEHSLPDYQHASPPSYEAAIASQTTIGGAQGYRHHGGVASFARKNLEDEKE